MQTNLLWQGIEYFSLENCLVEVQATGAVVTSTIVGLYQEKLYQVDYRIETDEHWQTVLLDINCRHNNRTQLIRLEGNGKGNWMSGGKNAPHFDGCIDVDIPLTPFTNTLPVRRLGLQPGESAEIRVLYCDLLAGELRPVYQRYTCLSATKYQYQNVPNDFEATIEVDEAGLVVNYPLLFVRKAAVVREK